MTTEIIGNLDELRGAKITGMSIVVNLNKTSEGLKKKELFQILYLPPRCRKPRVLLIEANNDQLMLNLQ